MDAPYQAADDVHVFPVNVPLPGVGVLPINAFLVLAEEPVLIDTGIGVDSDDFIAALSSIIDLNDLKWLWLTHDDADHTGSVQRVMELAPNATLVTHGFSALRMSTGWPVPMDRVHAIRFGDQIQAGDRTLTAVAPPLFDSPLSIGVLDESNGALFSVDAFGDPPGTDAGRHRSAPGGAGRRHGRMGDLRLALGAHHRPIAVRAGPKQRQATAAQAHLLLAPASRERNVPR